MKFTKKQAREKSAKQDLRLCWRLHYDYPWLCHPQVRVVVTVYLNLDLNRVSMCYDLWGIKLDASKIKTMIVSRSCTIHPRPTALTLDGTVLKDSSVEVILGWHLIVRWPLRNTYALFLELQLRGLVSIFYWWETPDKHFMIGHFFWDLFGALSCWSWSIAMQSGAQQPITP